jgi:hypothetical protein
MRVQNPDRYAEVLLALAQSKEPYSAARIRSMYGGGERNIPLEKPIPVHLTYQTAFVDENGELQLRHDIYGHDQTMLGLLRGSSRAVADVPVSRDYTSSAKPVMAQVARPEPRPFWWWGPQEAAPAPSVRNRQRHARPQTPPPSFFDLLFR